MLVSIYSILLWNERKNVFLKKVFYYIRTRTYILKIIIQFFYLWFMDERKNVFKKSFIKKMFLKRRKVWPNNCFLFII